MQTWCWFTGQPAGRGCPRAAWASTVQRWGEALDKSCSRVKLSPSSHSRGPSGREVVFHTGGDALKWEKVGVDLGLLLALCGVGSGCVPRVLSCGHSLLASLKMLAFCFKVRIVCCVVCWPLLRSPETVHSISI